MKIRIEPYKTWSGGARRLGRRAGILRATKSQVKRHGDFDLIINWGKSEKRFNGKYINEPEAVIVASNKLQTANKFKENKIPQAAFTELEKTANGWLKAGFDVLSFTLLRGSEGRGIKLARTGVDKSVAKAPLYRKYVKKTDEYRVHVWRGEVIDVQQKRRNKDVQDADVNWQIRNHSNGFIYARDGCNPPTCIGPTAIAAVGALRLDFGAVDLGYNQKAGKCVAYEVNTAPGLEGTTLDKYYAAILKTYPQLNSGMYAKRRTGRRRV